MSISFLYKNLIGNAQSITENQSTSGWGTSFLYDNDIHSAFRGTNTTVGTTTVLFTFGSAVYIDSIVCITNLTIAGTLILRAGTLSSVGDFISAIPVDGLGTSHKFIGNNGYKFWQLDLYGATGLGKHQLNELFLGKRKVINEMPSYPIENSIEEDVIDLISERGQRWIYNNYDREYWVFDFEGVNETTENDLYNLYKYVQKNTQPFWMCLNPDNDPLNIKFIRFRDKAYLSDEITKNIFDISLEIIKEI